MCKLLMLTNAKKLHPKQFEKLINVTSKYFSSTEKDGFGYAYSSGKQCIVQKSVSVPFYKKDNLTYPFIEKSHSTGPERERTGALLIHGRTATNAVNIVNTQPLQNATHTIVHNGCIQHTGKAYLQTTTNDSEHILHYAHSVDDLHANVKGSYAIGIIEHSTGKLIVAKNASTSLCVAWIAAIDSFVFCTTRPLLLKIANAMRWQIKTIDTFKANYYAIFAGNKILKHGELTTKIDNDYSQYADYSSKYTDYSSKYTDYSSKYTDYSSKYTDYSDSYGNYDNTKDVIIYDAYGREISHAEYMQLETNERERCFKTNKAGHYLR